MAHGGLIAVLALFTWIHIKYTAYRSNAATRPEVLHDTVPGLSSRANRYNSSFYKSGIAFALLVLFILSFVILHDVSKSSVKSVILDSIGQPASVGLITAAFMQVINSIVVPSIVFAFHTNARAHVHSLLKGNWENS